MNYTRLACASIAVPSIDEALPAFTEGMGLRVLGSVQTSERGYGLRWIELGNDDGVMLELIEPTGEGGPVQRFLERPGSSRIYQIRLYTENLEKALSEAENNGLRVVRGPIVADQPPLGFIHPSETGGALIEVMQVETEKV